MPTFDFALNDQTVTSSGSFLHDGDTSHEHVLFWNIVGPITGSSPTITFSLQEIDPNDRVSAVGQLITSPIINTTGTGQITLTLGISPLISVIWTVTGGSPSFSHTSAGIVSREIGNTIVGAPPSDTTNVTSVAASVTNVTLLSANTKRRGATIWNESNASTLFVKLGSTASASSYTAQVYPSGYYEVPYEYTGRIDGIWSLASGNARITELT